MAFVKVEKSTRSLEDGEPAVGMGAYLADGKVHKSRSVAFRLTRHLVVQLGWKPDDEGRFRIGVFEGTDKDVGFLQLMPDPKGYTGSMSMEEGSRQGMAVSVTIERFKHYVLNECPVPSSMVTHMIDGGALIIECPDWLRFNPLSVPQIVEPPPPVEKPKPEVKLNRDQRRRAGKLIANVLR